MAVEIIGSAPIVQEHMLPQQLAIASLRECGFITEIDTISVGTRVYDDEFVADPSVKPYLKMLGVLSNQVGVVHNSIECFSVEEAADAVRASQGRPTMVMSDEKIRDHLGFILEGMRPEDDIDGMTVEGRQICKPATGLSVVDYADWIVSDNNRRRTNGEFTGGLESVNPDRIAVVGETSRLVGAPAIERMWDKWRIEPGIRINKNNSERIVPRLRDIADVVIACTGIAGLIEPDDIIRDELYRKVPLVIIDAGVAEHKKLGPKHVYGDVHPDAYDIVTPDRLRISPAPVIRDGERLKRGSGVGRLTVAHLVNNAILVTEQRAKKHGSVPAMAS